MRRGIGIGFRFIVFLFCCKIKFTSSDFESFSNSALLIYILVVDNFILKGELQGKICLFWGERSLVYV